MSLTMTIFAWLLLGSGGIFIIIGGIGLLRLPDFYTRVHAASITDTVGAWLVLAGLMVAAGWTLVAVKLAMILVFLVLTSPLSSHALTKAAYMRGLEPLLGHPPREADEP